MEPLLEGGTDPTAVPATRRARVAGGEGDEDSGSDMEDMALAKFGGLAVSAGPSTSALSAQGGRGVVKAKDGADFLANHRTFKGMDAPVAGAEYKAPAAAVEGLAGRAAVYSQEPTKGDGK
uniref:Uncharacterized protein n=1 Tax=Chlamydomonas leiostraca TaxID=1034604 RepID=A0A7S0RPL4_9CHLO